MNTSNDTASQIPVMCEVCGRQDDTVRYVSYPFVFSFVVLTFQRVFTGCWCRLHRIQRWFAASFITSVFGWLGIPFGVALTPVRLLQLARGGLQDNTLNGQILRLIGEQKLQSGDSQGAIRCFEASLLYADDEGVSEQLKTLFRSQSSTGESTISGVYSLFLFPLISIGFAVIGLIVGVLDYIVRWQSSFLPQELSIFVLILLQVPFVILVYFCGALLSHVVQLIVRLARVGSVAFLSIASLITSLFFINGIVSGSTYGIYFDYFANGVREMPDEIPVTLIAILTHSIPYIFSPASFASNFSGNALFAVLLSLSFLLFVLTLMPKIKMLAIQQERISRLQNSESLSVPSFPILGMVGVFGLVLGFVLLFISAPQMSSVDALEAFDHVAFASGHMNSGEYAQAIIEYRQAIELKPTFLLGYNGLGYAYYFTGDLEQAKVNFELAISLQPESDFAHSGLGWVYLQMGNSELASEEFNNALDINPQNLDGHLGLGWVYLNQFMMNDSRKEFEYVISVAPKISDAYFGLGILELSLFNYDRAIELMDNVLSINPNMPGAYYYQGMAFYRLGMYAKADSAFKNAQKILPNDYDVLRGLGDIKVANNKFDDGLEFYDKAIHVAPERVDAYLDKVSVLIQMGKFDQAIPLIEGFSDENPKIEPTLAYIYYLVNNEIVGDKLYRSSASRVDELNGFQQAEVYALLAGVDYSRANFLESKKYLEMIPEIYMGSEALFFLSRVHSALGEFDAAEEYIQRGGEIGHSEVLFHITMSSILIDQEKLDEAYKELQDVLSIDDENSNAHAYLSFIYFQEGNLPRASFAARTALNLNPYNYYAHQQLAFIYHAQGNVDVALTEAQEAVRLQTLDSPSHYILGVCYLETGQTEDAIHEFEQFLDLYWDRAYVRDYKVKAEEFLEQLKQPP